MAIFMGSLKHGWSLVATSLQQPWLRLYCMAQRLKEYPNNYVLILAKHPRSLIANEVKQSMTRT